MPETATDPLILAAEQADAEAAAAEAEALAAQASASAARARARAAKLRREVGEQRVVVSEAVAGTAAAPAESGLPGPAPTGDTAPTEDTASTASTGPAAADGSGESGSAGIASGTLPPASEAASSGSRTALLSKSSRSEAAAPPTGSAGATAGRSGSEIDRSKDVGSEVDTAAGSGASAGVSKEATTDRDSGAGTVTKRRVSVGLGKLAGRLGTAGRRGKTSTVRRPSRRGIARVLVAVIVLAALVTGGYSIWNHQQIVAEQAREDEFLNAAREGVVALTTLDSGRAADDVQRVLDHSTGAFRTDFQTRSEDFTKVVEQSAVATQGEITAAAVESMTDDSAVVLVSAVSKVTNSAGAQQEPRVWRLSVTVTREGSEPKMSKVEFVP